DDLPYRLLTLAGMLGIAALAVNVRHVLEGASAENAFVLSYVAIRLVLLVMYARARRHVERARPLATVFLTMFGLAVLVWVASLFVAGLASLGTGVKLAIFDAAGRNHYADTSWVMCVGMALFLAGLGVIHLVTPPTRVDFDVALRLGSAAYALALVALVTVVPAVAIAWLLAAAGIAQVGVELF